MMERHRAQLKERLTNYGRMVCLDMWLGKHVWPQLRETMIELRKIQPDVMFRARGIGDYGHYHTPEHVVPKDKDSTDMPWFVICPLVTVSPMAALKIRAKGASGLFKISWTALLRGGNFMVGVGPDGNSQFNPTAVGQLKEVGHWLKVNGRSALRHAAAPRRSVERGRQDLVR